MEKVSEKTTTNPQLKEMHRNNVVLVDENDNTIAKMEKLVAHEEGREKTVKLTT